MEVNLSRKGFLDLFKTVSAGFFLPKRILNFNLESSRYSTDILGTKAQAALVLKANENIAENPEKAMAVSQKLLNSINAHPNAICGPLSFDAISRIVTHGVSPREFWLAEPEGPHARPELFELAFPVADFNQYRRKESVASFDFDSLHLQPGDFLYLFGSNRGYDHMITVTRRDQADVLYTVTNFPRSDGQFIIAEVPLWDPHNKESSFMRLFAKGLGPNRIITGDAGFMLWRLKAGKKSSYDQFEHSFSAEVLQREIDQIVRKSQADWNILITDLDKDKIIAESASRWPHHPASIIKVPLAMAVLKQIETEFEAQSELDFTEFINRRGFGGKTFDQLLSAMLINSVEADTEMLIKYLSDRKQNTLVLFNSWQSPHTFLSPRRSTAEDIYHFFKQIFENKTFAFPQSREYLLKLLSSYTEADDSRVGTLRYVKGLSVGKIYNKRASVAQSNLLTVGDAGVIELFAGGRKQHFIVYFIGGDPKGNSEVSYTGLEAELTNFVAKFAKYCQQL